MFICDCAREFKNQGALNLHRKACKLKGLPATMVEAVQEATPVVMDTVVDPPVEQVFFSPRANGLHIIIEPSLWKEIQTPAGSKLIQFPGREVTFEAGLLKTSDPVVIDYLENVYKDKRFPIYSKRKIREMSN